MSDYTQATQFGPKDSLTTGDPAKKIKGSEFDTEFEAIETAIGTKANMIGGATDGNLVAMDSNGDIKDSGETVSSVVADAQKPGFITMYGAASAPSGWLLCDGSAVNRTTYSDLFAVIGTTYGNGNGSTTFNVPDLKGRFPLGYGAGSGLTSRSLGDEGGEEDHTLTEAEMPSHDHEMQTAKTDETASSAGGQYIAGYNSVEDGPTNVTTNAIRNAGSGNSHNNMPPYLCVNFIIKT